MHTESVRNGPKRAARPILMYAVTAPETAIHFLRGQLSFMAAQGYEVHLLCGAADDALRELCTIEGAALHIVNVSRRPNPLGDVRGWLQIAHVIRATRPRVLIAGTPKMSLLSLTAAWALRVPRRIYLCHGLRYEGADGLANLALAQLERALMFTSTDVVAVSRSVRRRLQETARFRRQIHVLGHGSANGVDVQRFNGKGSDTPADPARSGANRPFVITFVGRITHDKGTSDLEFCARHFADQPSIQIRIIGKPEPADTQDKLQIQRLFEFPGVEHVEHTDDIESVYRSTDILILPTRREGLPTVVIEAGACGVPTIAYAATGTVDCIIDGVTGVLVPQGDRTALVQAVEASASDRRGTQIMGREAAQLVRTRYRQEDVWQRWGQFLEARGAKHPVRVRPRHQTTSPRPLAMM